jgi:putative Ca2+/H+ antiporter (TMEM165/GDT1 family)
MGRIISAYNDEKLFVWKNKLMFVALAKKEVKECLSLTLTHSLARDVQRGVVFAELASFFLASFNDSSRWNYGIH